MNCEYSLLFETIFLCKARRTRRSSISYWSRMCILLVMHIKDSSYLLKHFLFPMISEVTLRSSTGLLCKISRWKWGIRTSLLSLMYIGRKSVGPGASPVLNKQCSCLVTWSVALNSMGSLSLRWKTGANGFFFGGGGLRSKSYLSFPWTVFSQSLHFSLSFFSLSRLVW